MSQSRTMMAMKTMVLAMLWASIGQAAPPKRVLNLVGRTTVLSGHEDATQWQRHTARASVRKISPLKGGWYKAQVLIPYTTGSRRRVATLVGRGTTQPNGVTSIQFADSAANRQRVARAIAGKAGAKKTQVSSFALSIQLQDKGTAGEFYHVNSSLQLGARSPRIDFGILERYEAGILSDSTAMSPHPR